MRGVNAAVVRQAVWGVARTLHPDRERYRRGERTSRTQSRALHVGKQKRAFLEWLICSTAAVHPTCDKAIGTHTCAGWSRALPPPARQAPYSNDQ